MLTALPVLPPHCNSLLLLAIYVSVIDDGMEVEESLTGFSHENTLSTCGIEVSGVPRWHPFREAI